MKFKAVFIINANFHAQAVERAELMQSEMLDYGFYPDIAEVTPVESKKANSVRQILKKSNKSRHKGYKRLNGGKGSH